MKRKFKYIFKINLTQKRQDTDNYREGEVLKIYSHLFKTFKKIEISV